jgi:hypothetical protein
VGEEKDVAGEALIGEFPVQYFNALALMETTVPADAIRVSLHFRRRASNSSVKFSVKVVDPVPTSFVAEIVTEKTPPTVGVPVMAPVEVLKFKPAGREVAL